MRKVSVFLAVAVVLLAVVVPAAGAQVPMGCCIQIVTSEPYGSLHHRFVVQVGDLVEVYSNPKAAGYYPWLYLARLDWRNLTGSDYDGYLAWTSTLDEEIQLIVQGGGSPERIQLEIGLAINGVCQSLGGATPTPSPTATITPTSAPTQRPCVSMMYQRTGDVVTFARMELPYDGNFCYRAGSFEAGTWTMVVRNMPSGNPGDFRVTINGWTYVHNPVIGEEHWTFASGTLFDVQMWTPSSSDVWVYMEKGSIPAPSATPTMRPSPTPGTLPWTSGCQTFQGVWGGTLYRVKFTQEGYLSIQPRIDDTSDGWAYIVEYGMIVSTSYAPRRIWPESIGQELTLDVRAFSPKDVVLCFEPILSTPTATRTNSPWPTLTPSTTPAARNNFVFLPLTFRSAPAR